ncbi:MAG: hypothetical protein R3F59_16825 [Myxococcota bacterium]
MPQNEQSTGEHEGRCSSAVDLAELGGRSCSERLPEGFWVHGATEIVLSAPSLMSLNHGQEYTFWLPDEPVEAVRERVAALLAAESLPIERAARPVKGGGAPRVAGCSTLRLHAVSLTVRDEGAVPAVDLRLAEVDGRRRRAREVLDRLTHRPRPRRRMQRDTPTRRGGQLESMLVGIARQRRRGVVVVGGRARGPTRRGARTVSGAGDWGGTVFESSRRQQLAPSPSGARLPPRRAGASTPVEDDEAERFRKDLIAGMGECSGPVRRAHPRALRWPRPRLRRVMHRTGRSPGQRRTRGVRRRDRPAAGDLNRFGSEAQQERWLPGLAAGELLGAFALSEPDSGSDAASLKTTAERTSDGYWLNGTKFWTPRRRGRSGGTR